MKYGSVDLGRFDKLFSPQDRIAFQKFMDTKNLWKENNKFWAQLFVKDGVPTATSPDGSASFKVMAIEKTVSPMADFVTPFSDNPQSDKDGFKHYLGTIPDFGRGWTETALERYQKELMFKEFGSDADIINQYVDTVQKLMDAGNARLSHMAAQLDSTGQIVTSTGNGRGQGLPYKCKAEIPAANFLTCGTKVWSDPDCDIPKQMAQIEEDARNSSAFEGVFQWEIDENFLKTTFLNNTYVRSMVLNYFAGQRVTYDSKFVVTYPMLLEAMNDDNVRPFSKIVPIFEKQVEQTLTTRTVVHGWDTTIAVLRPAGYAGVIKYTSIPEIIVSNNYATNVIQKTTALVDGGIFGLINYIKDNGGYPEWHTDLRGSCVPALTEFPYHFIVDMTAKDS